MRSFLAGPLRGRASHPVSCAVLRPRAIFLLALMGSRGSPCSQRWVGEELLGEEPVRGLHVPLWTRPRLKCLAERLWGPMKLAGWRGEVELRMFQVSWTPRWGPWSLRGCPTLAVTQRRRVWGFSNIRGGAWCFPSCCGSALHVPSPSPLHGGRERGNRGPRDGWRSRSALPDWRFHPSPLLLPSFPHPQRWCTGLLRGFGGWCGLVNSQSASVFSWAQPVSMYTAPCLFHAFWEQMSFGLPPLETSGAWMMSTRTSTLIVCHEKSPGLQHGVSVSVHSVPGGSPVRCWL